MEPLKMPVRRRTFNALTLGVVSAFGIRADDSLGKRTQFLLDLSRGFEQQVVGVDLGDINLILRSMRDPVLGTAIGVGAERAVDATVEALQDAGHPGRYSIVTMAFAPMRWRLAEYRAVLKTARAQLDTDTGLQIYVICTDDQIDDGQTRVSVLTG